MRGVLSVVDTGTEAIDALLAHEPTLHDPTQFLPMHAGKDAAADIGVRYACDGAADLELAPAVMPFFVERREALPPGVTQGFGRVLVVAACGEAGVA